MLAVYRCGAVAIMKRVVAREMAVLKEAVANVTAAVMELVVPAHDVPLCC